MANCSTYGNANSNVNVKGCGMIITSLRYRIKMDKENLDRRQFFRKNLISFLDIFETPVVEKKSKMIRPPGAKQTEEEFLNLCEGCAKCTEACTFNAIEMVQTKEKQTPVLQLEKTPCRWCVDMPCIVACPSGALSFPEEGDVPSIGKAKINMSLCLNSHGMLCDECAIFCPTNIKAITMKNRKPELDLDKCTGCGVCSYYCQADSNAIEILNEGLKNMSTTLS